MAAGTGPLLGAGKRGSALSAMIVGGVLYALLATFNIQYQGFHPIVPALLLSLLAFLIGNRFGSSASQATILSTDK